ncbi:hypothetical protein X798_03793 [Onchocerca flexuosa]|uniref:Damage-specific DNA-binding protein 1 n=1 Tax=Onchocerca flexuosa TaxID=387005 RepID=A0A238BV76_9BILA|nr:hypothetical protein X798_03793 [Onchocerca flexuosa]
MALNYIVTAYKPTVVTHALVGSFIVPTELNLVLAKTNRVELFLVTPEGLKPHRECPVFGRIATIKLFRAPDEDVDSLLILTAKYHLAIIRWTATSELRTRASGHIVDRVGRPSETGMIATVHSSGLMVFRLYDGLLKVVQWNEGKDLRGFNVRCDDLYIIDITFMSDPDRPTLAYIYQDDNGRHIKVVTLNIDDKELSSPLWKHDNLEGEASMVISVPEPVGGCLIAGPDAISYHKGGDDALRYAGVPGSRLHNTHPHCYAPVDRDGQRYLVADLAGNLYMLLLELDRDHEDDNLAIIVRDMKVESLGETCIAECMCYLDNGVCFIGSRFGDSQLIRLSTEPRADGTGYISLLDSYTNLAPIRDMTIMRCNGQQQILTCSGAYKDGTIRIIRNGIGIEELASVELKGIKNMFSLRINDHEFDNYLILSFDSETHILLINGEELEDTQIAGFATEGATLWAGCLFHSKTILQVTHGEVILIDGSNIQIWKAPKWITLVAVNEITGMNLLLVLDLQLCCQLVVACGALLVYLEANLAGIKVITELECEFEISCIDITPIGNNTVRSEICAVGYWTDLSVALRTLPQLMEVVREKIAGDMLSRSIMLSPMEGHVYLLVALGDGTVHYFQIDMKTGALLDPKKATLGTQPIHLRKFRSRCSPIHNIFVCSDRPAVIYSSNQKLLFSNVNLRMVSIMTPLHAEAYPDALVLTDGHSLVIGRIDDIQKLHIRTVPLGESPSRIAYQSETNTIAVTVERLEFVDAMGKHHFGQCASKNAMETSSSRLSSMRREPTPECLAEEMEVSSVLLLDSNTFEILHSHELEGSEMAMSLASCQLGNDSQPYFVVGTAVIMSDETESKMGRILMFQASEGPERMRLVYEKEIKGAAYSIQSMDGKLVVAVNSCVRLFEWTADKELRLECSDFDNVTALYLKTKNDLILVGDLMRSLSLLSYKSMESTFEKVARDFMTNWMSACEIIDSDNFLGAENSFNLFTVIKDSFTVFKEEGTRLQELGLFYLGEMVNVFCHGSLTATQVDVAPLYHSSILYGTSDGGIGVIVQIPPILYTFLQDVQKRLAEYTENCMRISHTQYRTFETEKRSEPPNGFIDGDLIESFLDMSKDSVGQIIKGLKMPLLNNISAFETTELVDATAEDVLKLVEDLSRIH